MNYAVAHFVHAVARTIYAVAQFVRAVARTSYAVAHFFRAVAQFIRKAAFFQHSTPCQSNTNNTTTTVKNKNL
jgi:hypothetical protein